MKSPAAAGATLGPPDFTSTTTSSLVAGTLYQSAHGLSSTPDLVVVEYVCLATNGAWQVGDVIPWHGLTWDNNVGSIGEGGDIIGCNGTNVFFQTGANYLRLPTKSGSSSYSLAVFSSSWGIRFKVWENLSKETSSDLTVPVADGKLTYSHGLGSGVYFPKHELTCVIAEDGYAVGDVIENYSYLINSGNGTNTSRAAQIGYNSTEVFHLTASANYLNKGTGQNAGAPTEANWESRLTLIELPPADFTSSGLSPALATALTAAHGLSTVDFMLAEMVCIAPDDNWAIGDRMPMNWQAWDRASDDNNARGSTAGYDATNCYFILPPTYNMIHLDKNTPTATAGAVMNLANWEVVFSAWGTV
jgi:hypothetical protein